MSDRTQSVSKSSSRKNPLLPAKDGVGVGVLEKAGCMSDKCRLCDIKGEWSGGVTPLWGLDRMYFMSHNLVMVSQVAAFFGGGVVGGSGIAKSFLERDWGSCVEASEGLNLCGRGRDTACIGRMQANRMLRSGLRCRWGMRRNNAGEAKAVYGGWGLWRMRMNTNNEMREDVYQFIVRFKRAHDGNSPSMDMIAAALYVGKTTAYYHVRMLEKEGRLRRTDGVKRSIEVVGGRWELEGRHVGT